MLAQKFVKDIVAQLILDQKCLRATAALGISNSKLIHVNIA